MRLTEYGRTPQKRKEYVYQPALLLVGVDVSKATHKAGRGPQTTMSGRTLDLTHTREGCRRLAQPLTAHRVKNGARRILIALEPSGISWQALDERLPSCGYEVCLGHGQAVRNTRQTLQDGTSKTDEKDAASLFALRRQGQCLLPVARDPARTAAYRWRPRQRALKKRVGPLRHHLRAAMHLAFPDLNPLVHDLTPPPA
jgi:hypothetical protein